MLLMLFSRLILRVLPLAAVLCAVVPAMGGRPLYSDEVWEQFGFTICELPCFAGITPGRTPFQQTPSLLRKNIPLIRNRMFDTGAVVSFWASTEANDLSGFTRHIWGVVDEIRLNSLLPVDHLIAELGTPDCILPNTQSESSRMTIFWERGQVSIGAVLSPDQPIINLNGDTLALWLRISVPGDCSRSGTLPWRGFAPLWAYSG
jgi:hypothetical protein